MPCAAVVAFPRRWRWWARCSRSSRLTRSPRAAECGGGAPPSASRALERLVEVTVQACREHRYVAALNSASASLPPTPWFPLRRTPRGVRWLRYIMWATRRRRCSCMSRFKGDAGESPWVMILSLLRHRVFGERASPVPVRSFGLRAWRWSFIRLVTY